MYLIQYFETRLGDRKDIRPVKCLCHLPSKVLFHDRWMKKSKGELVNPGSPGKWR